MRRRNTATLFTLIVMSLVITFMGIVAATEHTTRQHRSTRW